MPWMTLELPTAAAFPPPPRPCAAASAAAVTCHDGPSPRRDSGTQDWTDDDHYLREGGGSEDGCATHPSPNPSRPRGVRHAEQSPSSNTVDVEQ